jgi:hypothetical protein
MLDFRRTLAVQTPHPPQNRHLQRAQVRESSFSPEFKEIDQFQKRCHHAKDGQNTF